MVESAFSSIKIISRNCIEKNTIDSVVSQTVPVESQQ